MSYGSSSSGIHPVVLVVLDGWGYSENTEYNAIYSANTPCWDAIWAECPGLLLSASGVDVGLPAEQMGNSEVGHMHMGAGRVVPQDLTRIADAIEDGSFYDNAAMRDSFRAAEASGNAVHLAGIVSPGGVHGHEDLMIAAMKVAADCGVRKLFLHLFLDGRDTMPKSAAESIQRIRYETTKIGVGSIASIVGRYYAMDRNKHWNRTSRAWSLLMRGEAAFSCTDPLTALEQSYARDETDEFVVPIAIGSGAVVQADDLLVFLNFRADRIRQLAAACSMSEFTCFDRGDFKPPRCLSMTMYEKSFPMEVIFPQDDLKNVFGEVVSGQGLSQLRIAETEKYAHVTYFFNGGRELTFPGEKRTLVPSPHVATYDMKPEMSAVKITQKLIAAIRGRQHDVVICNYANADMVGHTGDLEATIRAVETIDSCLGKLRLACSDHDVDLLITADHGNAEQLRTYTNEKTPGQKHTAHTSNPVPLVLSGRAADVTALQGSLVDIAPTMLHLMGLPAPGEMTGRPLFQIKDNTGAVASVAAS